MCYYCNKLVNANNRTNIINNVAGNIEKIENNTEQNALDAKNTNNASNNSSNNNSKFFEITYKDDEYSVGNVTNKRNIPDYS